MQVDPAFCLRARSGMWRGFAAPTWRAHAMLRREVWPDMACGARSAKRRSRSKATLRCSQDQGLAATLRGTDAPLSPSLPRSLRSLAVGVAGWAQTRATRRWRRTQDCRRKASPSKTRARLSRSPNQSHYTPLCTGNTVERSGTPLISRRVCRERSGVSFDFARSVSAYARPTTCPLHT
eukprot:146504-Rhodomonas_salina.1